MKTRLYDIGLSERTAEEAAVYGGHLYLVRVSVHHRDMYKVITENGEIQAERRGNIICGAFRKLPLLHVKS
jgi:ribosome biogenesis GTPase